MWSMSPLTRPALLTHLPAPCPAEESEEDESEENGEEEEGDKNVHRGWRIHPNLMILNLVRMTLISHENMLGLGLGLMPQFRIRKFSVPPDPCIPQFKFSVPP